MHNGTHPGMSRRSVWMAALASLLIGSVIYILFRPEQAVFIKAFAWLGLLEGIEAARAVSVPWGASLPGWLVYSIPDGLWMFAYALVITHIWRKRRGLAAVLFLASVPALPLAYEGLQHLRALPGTACPMDAVLGLVGALLGLLCARGFPAPSRDSAADSAYAFPRWATALFLVGMGAAALGCADGPGTREPVVTEEPIRLSDGRTRINKYEDGKLVSYQVGRNYKYRDFSGNPRYHYLAGKVEHWRRSSSGNFFMESEQWHWGQVLVGGRWEEKEYSGWHYPTYVYDEHGNLLRREIYGAHGKLIHEEIYRKRAGTADSRITRRLEQDRPWVIRLMDSWGVNEDALDNLLVYVEQFILQAQPADRSEVTGAYEDAIDQAAVSVTHSNACKILASVVWYEAQAAAYNQEVHAAIFDWYLDGGGSLYTVFSANYPAYHATLLSRGVTAAQLQAFFDTLEGHLRANPPLNREDPLMLDALDQQIEDALKLIDQQVHLVALMAIYVDLLRIYQDMNPFLQAALDAFFPDRSRVIRLSGNLAFGSVNVGQTQQRTMWIHNDGLSNLTVRAIEYPASFSGAWSGVIQPGASQRVTVAFSPGAALAYGGIIVVDSDCTFGVPGILCSGTGVSEGCTWSLSPPSATFAYAGGSGTVTATVVSGSGCSRTASADVGWISIVSGGSGTGSGAIRYNVAANDGGARTGRVQVAGQTHTVVQAEVAEQTIFNNYNIYGVLNGPSQPTTFTISKPYRVTYIETYHYFNGGVLPGTLRLQKSGGSVYGPWQTTGAPGQGGVANAHWQAWPSQVIPAGTYQVVDSHPATWSYNSQSGNRGFALVRGIPHQEAATGPWSGASDLGGGWRWMSWFGYFIGINQNWIWHSQHDWIYGIGSPSSLWMWTGDMGWLWTSSSAYSYLYRLSDGAWLWYQKGSDNPRWFINLDTAVWESH